MTDCAHCGAEIPERITPEMVDLAVRMNGTLPAPTRPRRFCSDACRRRAWRRRQAGLAEDAYPEGASRGHVPLGRLTYAEEAEQWAAIAAELAQAAEALR